MHNNTTCTCNAHCTHISNFVGRKVYGRCHVWVVCVLYHFVVGRLERQRIRQNGNIHAMASFDIQFFSWTSGMQMHNDGSDDNNVIAKKKSPNELNNLIRKIGLFIVRDFFVQRNYRSRKREKRKKGPLHFVRYCVTLEHWKYEYITTGQCSKKKKLPAMTVTLVAILWTNHKSPSGSIDGTIAIECNANWKNHFEQD